MTETEQQEMRWHLAVMVPRLALTAKERQVAISSLESYLEEPGVSSGIQERTAGLDDGNRTARNEVAFSGHGAAARPDRQGAASRDIFAGELSGRPEFHCQNLRASRAG